MPAGDAVYNPKESSTFSPAGLGVPVVIMQPELGRMHNFNSAIPVRPSLSGRLLAGEGQLPVVTRELGAGDTVPLAGLAPPPPVPREVVEAGRTEEGSQISSDRVAFLERIEDLMAEGSKTRELEKENETLLGIVNRLAAENKALKAKK
jgi:hypothetical protein